MTKKEIKKLHEWLQLPVAERRKRVPKKMRCGSKRCDNRVGPPASIKCTKCGRQYCCMECAIDSSAIDHATFDRVWFDKNPSPDQYDIECCFCTGNKRSYEDRD